MNLAFGLINRLRRNGLTVQATAGVLVGAVVLLLVGLDLRNTWAARAVTLNVARIQAQNLADSLAQEVARAIEFVDLPLREVQERVAADGLDPASMPSIEAFLKRSAHMTPQLRDLVVLDRAGNWLASSMPRSAADASGRDFFFEHRDRPGHELSISKPYLSRTTGLLSIAISRRLDDAEGRFVGVVLAAIDIDFLGYFYDSFTVGPHDAIALFRADGVMLARRPLAPAVLGRSFAGERLFHDHLAHGERSGSFTAPSPVDGVRHLESFRRSGDLPLVVLIATSEDDVLAAWRHDARIHLVGIGLLGAAVALLGWRIAWLWRRQRAVERAAAQAMADYRLLADNAGDMIVVNDLATLQLRYVSPAARAIFGVPAVRLMGTRVDAFLHPDDRAGVVAMWQALRDGAEQAMNSHRIRHADGRWVWVETKSQAVRDDEGRPTGEAVTVVRDVSERIAAERAMRESELRFRAIGENATDIILRIGPDGRRRYVSPACREILGVDPAEMIGHGDLRQVHPDDRAMVARKFWATMEGDGPEISIYSFRAFHRDGSLLWLEARDRVMRDEASGQAIELISMLRDVTERVLNEDELRESEARYRLLAENATDMIIRLTLDGQRVYMSPAHKEILGYEVAELMATRSGSLVVPADKPMVDAALAELASGARDMVSIEYRVRHRNGHPIWVETRLKLVRDPATDAPVEIVGVVRDNSRQKANEEKLRAAHEEAERSNRMRSAFFSNMSHELRTPLNAVIGFADLMRQETLGPLGLPKYREYAEDIHASGEHLLGIINDILDFAKLEAGALTLHREPMALGPLVAAGCRLMAAKAAQKGVDLTFEAAAEAPEAFGDPVRTRQVLLNLLSNAIKFTQAGGKVAVTVGAGADGAPVIAVADTGIGIAAEDLVKVVEPFGQVDNARNREGDGTGLGLPLSRRLMEMQGGALEIASHPGVGTTVTVRFLRAEGALLEE